ncbi:MAG: alkaline phosphatase [Candidatus Marinimicrobia bacterium]|nr:alkaline phosphatase [Candidatus Neomarinimicrobiota bacterium]MCF7903525.1 alkaline phosphatase [Candidatus Neomarinimicrobiota bacterium]
MITGISLLLISCVQNKPQPTPAEGNQLKTGSVIFIHPDGVGANTWNALRAFKVGPDAMLNWDRMEKMGVYRSHQLDVLGTSSNAGATAHAFGVKAEYDDYGIDPDRPINALSGKPLSLMQEAMAAGMSVAAINTGHINEPGSGVYLASAKYRKYNDEIAEKIIRSGADILLSGGEKFLLPEGVEGQFGPGGRQDSLNLIEVAQANGYTVVYNRTDFLALPTNVEKVLGVFAHIHTFDDRSEEALAADNSPMYSPNAPSLVEMMEVSLRILSSRPEPFLIVMEEEGTDNFGNHLNATGVFEALGRADDAIGVVLEHIEANPNTLLVVASDSDAGGLQIDFIKEKNYGKPLAANTSSGSALDGKDGTGSLPFTAKPDQYGTEFEFSVCWSTSHDVYGGVIAKAHGLNASRLPNNVDNTDIYRVMYATLFGKWLP